MGSGPRSFTLCSPEEQFVFDQLWLGCAFLLRRPAGFVAALDYGGGGIAPLALAVWHAAG